MIITRTIRALLATVLASVLALSASRGFAQQASAPVVNDALLLRPPADSWVTYGHGYDETHHSPLTQIDKGSVSRLGLAWSVDVGNDGKIETTPIVWNGVLYGTGAYSVVYAIDIKTQTLKWRWDPALVRGGYPAGGPRFCCGPVNRGVALYNGNVYVGLLDGRLVALNAGNGRMAWTTQTTPQGSDYSITGAPRVVKGKVIIGNGGAEYGGRGYMSAYDAASGELKWRFYVVPGDPSKPFEDEAQERAAKTWKGEWWKIGGGGHPWDGIAYDPEADLLYFGTGNGAPWNQQHRSPGGGDNLYLSSIVAVKPDTGKYVWHYQTTPGDNWDYNAAQSLVLANLTIQGRPRKVIMQAPKNGFFYVIDRITGEFISGAPFVNVTWATGIDAKGRPIEAANARYGATPTRLTPGPGGAHHWPPMAFNPATQLAYFIGQENGSMYSQAAGVDYQIGRWNTGTNYDAVARGNGGAVGAAPNQTAAVPPPPVVPPPVAGATAAAAVPPVDPIMRGFLVGWDPIAQKAKWRIASPGGGGSLSTAGGLVFGSDSSGRFYAVDAATGATLWETRLQSGVATPVTYTFEGKQYVSVMSGSSRGRLYTFVLDGKAPTPGR